MRLSNISIAVSLSKADFQLSVNVFSANANFVYAVLRSKKKFEALRTFTLESGQEQIERQKQRRKEDMSDTEATSPTRASSVDSLRSHNIQSPRTPTLRDVPEETSAFAVGEDESDDDEDDRPTPSPSSRSPQGSRAPSVASSVDDAMPLQLRGMSEKARGKRPAGTPAFSRQNSTTSLSSHAPAMITSSGGFSPSAQWIETWLPQLPLHTILTLTQELSPRVARASNSSASPSILQTIRSTPPRGVDPSPIRVHLFEWSPLSLGWYESLLWGFIFTSEMHVAKGTVGVWNGTAIKLFRVQETAAEGPTLMAPRGAVDAVGSNIVQRIGNLNLRGAAQGQHEAHPRGNVGASGGGTQAVAESPVRSAVV